MVAASEVEGDREALQARASARQRLANRGFYLLVFAALYLGAGWIGSIQYIVDQQFLSSSDYREVTLPIVDVGAAWPLVYTTGPFVVAVLMLAYAGSLQASLRDRLRLYGTQDGRPPDVLTLVEESDLLPHWLRWLAHVIRPVILFSILIEMTYFLYRIYAHSGLEIGVTGQVLLWLAAIFLLCAWWGLGVAYRDVLRARPGRQLRQPG